MDLESSYIQAISSKDKVTIYDISFNHYGKRMAVCSSDQLITVWDQVNDSKEWKKTAEWKPHEFSPLKITWVHPEFGHALATCSVDRYVAIWEEIQDDNNSKIEQVWVQRASLLGSTTFITDIKFAPKTVGLLLAICSSDGFIRIFKSLDILDLSRWSLQQEVCYRHRVSCIAWNPNGVNNGYSCKYFKIDNVHSSDRLRKDAGSLYSLYPSVINEPNAYIVLSQDPMLVVGFDNEDCQTEDKIKILLYASRYQRWNKTEFSIKDKYLSEITDPIRDLAFSVRLGRTYDLLAVATKDIKIYALYQLFNQSHLSFRFQICLINSFQCHNSSILRINWNPLGNILISSGDDGYVKVWKQYQVLSEKKEEKPLRQKTSFQMKNLQYCWKSVRIIKISGLQS
ncbi:nucleoporin SEH1 [Halyomorpha halys]|uniref:nucleoporin SEH1 n=1 Tax=Halyomorpha halys TaxID=286706 RepID=UPI0006D51CD0|nr:nucleoporin SEH1-like [Halyomorpha halys]